MLPASTGPPAAAPRYAEISPMAALSAIDDLLTSESSCGDGDSSHIIQGVATRHTTPQARTPIMAFTSALRNSISLSCCLAAAFICCRATRSEELPSERRLISFEPAEVAHIIDLLAKQEAEVTRTAAESSDGVEQVTLAMQPWRGFSQWTLRRGEASQGEWALALRPTTLSYWTGRGPPPKLEEVDRFYLSASPWRPDER